jgi:predicted dehydrogenase
MERGQKYEVLLVGCGGIGYQYDMGEPAYGRCSHFRAFNQSSKFSIMGVVDHNNDLLRQIEQKHNVATFPSLTDVASTPDVVVIATPDESHYQLLQETLTLAPKVVLCEKPLASNHMEVADILQKYSDAHVPVILNYYRRYHPVYKQVHKLLQSDALGQLDAVTCYYSRGLLHNGIHYFDLFRWWFGDIQHYVVNKVHPGLSPGDPTVSLCLTFCDHINVYLLGLPARKTIINEIDIIGEKGRITIDTFGKLNRYNVHTHPDYPMYDSYKITLETRLDIGKATIELPSALCRYLENGEMPPTPAEDSLPLYQQINKITGSLA